MLRQTLAHLRPSRPTPAGAAIQRDERDLPQIKMHRRHLEDLPPVNLPEGYTLRTYKEGDEVHWCNILNTTSVRLRRTSRPPSPPPDTPHPTPPQQPPRRFLFPPNSSPLLLHSLQAGRC